MAFYVPDTVVVALIRAIFFLTKTKVKPDNFHVSLLWSREQNLTTFFLRNFQQILKNTKK